MASFLEQINNKAAEQAEPDKKTDPEGENEENENIEEQPEEEKKAKLGGIKQTVHETEIDRGFLKKRLITIIVCSAIVCIVIAAIWFTVYTMRLVRVEDFSERTFAEMQKWAEECNMILDEKQVYDEDVSEGTVIEQSVAGGKKLPPRSVISVTVSKGGDPEQKIDVPDISAMTAADVRQWISDNSLSAVKIVEEYNDTVPKGNVIRFEFDSVSVTVDNFRRGDGLTVYASKGKQISTTVFKMPDLVGKPRAEVEAWAAEKKVTAAFKEELSESVDKGKVISQSAAKDTAIDAGMTVEFTVSAGAGITIPDYSRYGREEADSANADILVSKKSAYSTAVAYGDLISQSKQAGEKVLASDNSVELVYSLGAPYMPALVGKNESELPELFYNFNSQGTEFTYDVKYVDSSEPKGTVVWASKESEYVSLRENIALCVSKGNLTEEGA
ncbi:MAG: PASTA domain-containing protein [Clostridia bacterium]|nr:PASTA domain-containing protein [Clostridia bacterium]